MDEDEAKQMYAEFQAHAQQFQMMQQHMQKIDESLQELASTNGAIEELGKSEIDSEILVPMASGIFLRTKLASNSEVLMNVGASTVVSKSADEARNIIKEQEIDILNFRSQLAEQMQEVQKRIQDIQKKAENV